MTNNPTIDGVSRERIEAIAREMDRLGYGHHESHAESILNALLKVPADEQQELASPLSDIGRAQLLAICRGAAQCCEEQHDYMASASSDPHNWFPHKWVMDAMRSLLQINANNQQSTIARLEARITQLESEKELMLRGADVYKERITQLESEDAEWSAMQQRLGDENSQLRDRVAELESGRGEPVGRVSYIGSGFVRVRTTECLALEQPLFTAPPAPVAVVLPELERELGSPPLDHLRGLLELVVNPGTYPVKVLHDQIRATLRTMACLDATAALNEPAK